MAFNHKQKMFNGIDVEDSDTYIPDDNAVDCSNVVLNNPYGTINNDVGMAKWNTIGMTNPILAIHQLPKHRWANVTEDLFYFTNGNWYYNYYYVPWLAYTFEFPPTCFGMWLEYDPTEEDLYISYRQTSPTNIWIYKAKFDGSNYTAFDISELGFSGYISIQYYDGYIYGSTGIGALQRAKISYTDITNISAFRWFDDGYLTDDFYYDGPNDLLLSCRGSRNRIRRSDWAGTYEEYITVTNPIMMTYDSANSMIYYINNTDKKIYKREWDGSNSGSVDPSVSNYGNTFKYYDGWLYFQDAANDVAYRVSSDLSTVETYGENGSGEGQFSDLYSVIPDRGNYVFCGEGQENYRISRFPLDQFS